jgi:phospholipid N-methyltransferase
MRGISFFLQYIKHYRSVGAVAPSSRFLARKMMTGIDFEKARVIVEFGPGTGVFTDELLRRRSAGTVIISIERNEEFFQKLQEKYAQVPDLHLVHGSAEQIGTYLHEHGHTSACHIVSGLPFASIPVERSVAIIKNARAHLAQGGRFITFQYTLLRKGMLANAFASIDVKREWRNLPPAYVLSCAAAGE